MLKEIREYRSLAYTAVASYSSPSYPNWKSRFYASIGTQGDKTIEAVEVATHLLKDMLEYPERMKNVKDYLINSSFMSRPADRDLAYTVDLWKARGYKQDPTQLFSPIIKQMTFEDVVNFTKKIYKGNLMLSVSLDQRKK